MIKPIWAVVGGLALLGTAGGIGVLIATTGGEEEAALQNQQTASAVATVGPSPGPSPTVAGPLPAPTSEPSPEPLPNGWETYTDPELGFSFPHPAGLTLREGSYETHQTDRCPVTTVKTSGFDNMDSGPVVGVATAPNPCNLSLEEWIRTYPGWPCEPMSSPTCEPTSVTVGGERGIRFSIDTLGDAAARIYFAHAGVIYSLGGNVFGNGEGGYGPAISEEDFELVIQGFRFAS